MGDPSERTKGVTMNTRYPLEEVFAPLAASAIPASASKALALRLFSSVVGVVTAAVPCGALTNALVNPWARLMRSSGSNSESPKVAATKAAIFSFGNPRLVQLALMFPGDNMALVCGFFEGPFPGP